MQEQVPVSFAALADLENDAGLHEVADDLAYQRLAIVNAVYFGPPGAGSGEWLLIDAGVMGSTTFILDDVERRGQSLARKRLPSKAGVVASRCPGGGRTGASPRHNLSFEQRGWRGSAPATALS